MAAASFCHLLIESKGDRTEDPALLPHLLRKSACGHQSLDLPLIASDKSAASLERCLEKYCLVLSMRLQSVECTAAKEQCVADLKAKKAAGDANIITNPLQAAKKAAMTSEKHSYLQQLYQKAGHVTDPCLSAKSVCTATGLEQPACVSALVDAKAANCPLTWIYQAPVVDVVAEPVTTLPLTISPVTAQPVMTTVDPVMTTTASYL